MTKPFILVFFTIIFYIYTHAQTNTIQGKIGLCVLADATRSDMVLNEMTKVIHEQKSMAMVKDNRLIDQQIKTIFNDTEIANIASDVGKSYKADYIWLIQIVQQTKDNSYDIVGVLLNTATATQVSYYAINKNDLPFYGISDIIKEMATNLIGVTPSEVQSMAKKNKEQERQQAQNKREYERKKSQEEKSNKRIYAKYERKSKRQSTQYKREYNNADFFTEGYDRYFAMALANGILAGNYIGFDESFRFGDIVGWGFRFGFGFGAFNVKHINPAGNEELAGIAPLAYSIGFKFYPYKNLYIGINYGVVGAKIEDYEHDFRLNGQKGFSFLLGYDFSVKNWFFPIGLGLAFPRGKSQWAPDWRFTIQSNSFWRENFVWHIGIGFRIPYY